MEGTSSLPQPNPKTTVLGAQEAGRAGREGLDPVRACRPAPGHHGDPVRAGISALMSQKWHGQDTEWLSDLSKVTQLELLGWGSWDLNTSF